MENNNLNKYGFDNHFIEQYENNNTLGFPARVITGMGEAYILLTENGIVRSKVMGKFIYNVDENKHLSMCSCMFTFSRIITCLIGFLNLFI